MKTNISLFTLFFASTTLSTCIAITWLSANTNDSMPDRLNVSDLAKQTNSNILFSPGDPTAVENATQAAQLALAASAKVASELSELKDKIKSFEETLSTDMRSIQSVEDKMEQAKNSTDVQFGHFATEFAFEERDPIWSRDADDAISAWFSQTNVTHASLINSECKRSLCAMEIEFATEEAYEQFHLDFSLSIKEHISQMAVQREHHPDGRSTAIAYLGRSGYSMPALPN